jgi:hypothetical protein
MQNFLKHGLSMLIGGVLVAAILLATNASAQDDPVVPADAAVEAVAPIAPAMSYQGQLLDPFTSAPKHGDYLITFSIYDAPVAGSVLWNETKSIRVVDGLFSTLLGDVSPLNLDIFNGQQLWLGVKVGTDAETAPRQRLAYAPYSLYSANADTLDGLDSSAFVRAGQGGGAGSPIAFGVVNKDGGRESGSSNWSASRESDNGAPIYLIRIDGEDYNLDRYTTVVTGACGGGNPRIANTSSSNGRLWIEFYGPSGNRETCKFHFVVFKP